MAAIEPRVFSKPKHIYDILEQLGLRTVGSKAGRPKFPRESKLAKPFYWQVQQIFGEFRNGNIMRDIALNRTLDLLNEKGPSIWGADRSDLVDAHFYEGYPKDLHWEEPADQDLYVMYKIVGRFSQVLIVGSIRAQTIEMFEYRERKKRPIATAGQKRDAQGLSQNSSKKRSHRNSSPESGKSNQSASDTTHNLITIGVVLLDDGAKSEASEYSPSENSTPEPERPSRPPTMEITPKELIVKLPNQVCSRCGRLRYIVSRTQHLYLTQHILTVTVHQGQVRLLS